jgi:hypothetical protein
VLLRGEIGSKRLDRMTSARSESVAAADRDGAPMTDAELANGAIMHRAGAASEKFMIQSFLRSFSLILLIVAAGYTFGHADNKKPEYFGKFSSGPKNEFQDTGSLIKLIEDFIFTDARGRRWIAPSGFTSDGASIPDFAKSFIGGNFDGQYRKAAIIHDYNCSRRTEDWETVHKLFYEGMRAAKVGERKANIMYLAVYHFGPRWLNQAERDKECVGRKFDPKKCILNAGIPPAFEPQLDRQSFDVFLDDLRARKYDLEADQFKEEVEIK